MRRVLVLFALLATLPVARADEADDLLAKQLVGTASDPRLPIRSRVVATKAIAKLGPRASAVVPDLVRILDRLRGVEQEPLQEALVEAIGQIGSASRAALPTLARVSARSLDLELASRRSTDLILAASDEQDLDALVKQLASRDPSVRLRAIKAVGALGPVARGSAAPLVATMLGDPDTDVRRATIATLRLIQPNAKPTEALIRAVAVDLTDPDANARLVAVRSLGRIGTPAAIVVADLEALRMDPDPDVRKAVNDALARLAGP